MCKTSQQQLNESYEHFLRLFSTYLKKRTLLNKLTGRRKVYIATMVESEMFLTYVNYICQLASTLKSMRARVNDEEVAGALLNVLLERYNSLISALDVL